MNESFDHELHEAISQVVDKDRKASTVVNVVQAGYSIKDRLIRPALVIVTKNE